MHCAWRAAPHGCETRLDPAFRFSCRELIHYSVVVSRQSCGNYIHYVCETRPVKGRPSWARCHELLVIGRYGKIAYLDSISS